MNFSGRVNMARIRCAHLHLSGQGLLKNTVVSSSTNLDGNFIVTDSRLKTAVTLDPETTCTSFNNCLAVI